MVSSIFAAFAPENTTILFPPLKYLNVGTPETSATSGKVCNCVRLGQQQIKSTYVEFIYVHVNKYCICVLLAELGEFGGNHTAWTAPT